VDPVLAQYKQQITTWPHILPPTREDLMKSILMTNDSAPGPDGIPYAAWRLRPTTAAEAMTTHFEDICRNATPPPCSVQAWIPKAKLGPTADNFRPRAWVWRVPQLFAWQAWHLVTATFTLRGMRGTW